MRAVCPMRLLAIAALALSFPSSPASARQTALPRNGPLKIVVIEGEGAVNVIQQKTAVAPIVEVRDRNELPVAGATVAFTISGGKGAAFAGGANSITVTTNAAGRAAAASLSPLNSGAVQIQVSATFEGQSAAATIGQTNVMTASEAGSAGAGGGGLSGITIGLIGAAAAGGGVAAYQYAAGDSPAEAGSPVLSWVITTFRNGAQITPCQSPASTCELRLSDNNGFSQFSVHLLAVAQSADNSFVLECGGCQFTNFGSQVTYRFDVPPPGRSSGTTGIGYSPGMSFSSTGQYPARVTWTAAGAPVQTLSVLITVVP